MSRLWVGRMVKKFSKHTPEQIVRNRDWGAVVKGLAEAGLVSPGHPLESRDVNFEHIMPGRSVNRLVLYGPLMFSVNALS